MTEPSVAQKLLEPAKSYLVLVQPMLVANDISTAITEFVPGANVIMVKTPAEACKALILLPSIHLAFLDVAPGSETGLRLAVQVRLRGGRPVFIGDEADDLGPGPDWSVLVRPFTTQCLHAALCCAKETGPSDRTGEQSWRPRLDAPGALVAIRHQLEERVSLPSGSCQRNIACD